MADRSWRNLVRRPTNPDQYGNIDLSLVASGAPASGDQRVAAAAAKSAATRAAQSQVWAYRRQIGELAHAGQFYENSFSRIRMQIAQEEDDGSRTPAFDQDGKPIMAGAQEALTALRALRSPLGGSSHLMRQIGGCLAFVGEGTLVGVDQPSPKTGQAWEFLSPSEFHESMTQSSGTTEAGTKVVDYDWMKVPGQPPTKVRSDQAVIARVWQPDAEYSLLGWAAPMGMLDIFEELLLLTQQVAGAIKSRIAIGGVLLVADDIDFPAEEDDDPQADPYTTNFLRQISTAIKNPKSAAGVAPFIHRVAANRVADVPDNNGEQGFRFLKMPRDWDDAAEKKRDELLHRFAQGMDVPPERVFGHTDSTFTNADRISADEWATYVEPKVRVATDGLTTGYLQVVLPGTPFVIDPDPTDLLVAPDQTKDYIEAHKLWVISDAALRDKLGATEDDAPDDEEIARRIEIAQAVRIRQSGDVQPTDVGSEPIVADASIDAAREVTVRRSVERAGARIRSKASGRAGLASLIQNVPDSQVAATLGRTTVVNDLQLTEAELFSERDLASLRGWVTEHADSVVADGIVEEALREISRRLFATR